MKNAQNDTIHTYYMDRKLHKDFFFPHDQDPGVRSGEGLSCASVGRGRHVIRLAVSVIPRAGDLKNTQNDTIHTYYVDRKSHGNFFFSTIKILVKRILLCLLGIRLLRVTRSLLVGHDFFF